MKTTFRISRVSSVLTVFAIMALSGLTVSIQTAQAGTQFRLVRTLISPTPTGGSFFGKTLAVAGDRFLVGSDDCVTVCGAVHVFDSDGNFVRTILPPTAEGTSLFGDSVGAMGSNVLVGAPLDNTGGESAGAAYLFDGGTGDLLQTFLNPNPDHPPFSADRFGSSVAGFGNTVLVSAPLEDIAAEDAGAVYLFDGTGQLLRTFLSPNPNPIGTVFGSAIAVVGNNIAIAAVLDSTSAENGGAVYLFDGNGNLITTILSPRPVQFGSFGNALAAFGNNLLVAEQRGFTGDLRAGVVHLFDGTTGAFIRSFFNPTPENFEFFGNSLASSGNNVLVGAIRNMRGNSRVSAAYLLDGTTGNVIETFLNPDRSVQDSFAQQVAVIENSVLISSPSEPSNGSGVAYLFQPKRTR
jgi:hypothetical protein